MALKAIKRKFSTMLTIRNVGFALVIVGTFVLYILTQRAHMNISTKFPKNRMNDHEPETQSELQVSQLLGTVIILGTDISFAKLKDSNKRPDYLLIIPRASTEIHSLRNTIFITTEDKPKIARLLRILQQRRAFDGATCIGTSSNPPSSSTCYFESRKWTLLIGKSKTTSSNAEANITECNIIEHAFIIRRKVFEKLDFNQKYGETTLLDFYLRSKGRLKIAGDSSCSFSAKLNHRDRGGQTNNWFFTDYVQLANHHGIMRIVRENKITWTKCSYQTKLCPEKPLNKIKLTSSMKLLPICCSEVLDNVLVDVVHALNVMGLEYRVEYGTLLGAVRSGAIIPWTTDVDIGLKHEHFNDKTFTPLKSILGLNKYAHPTYPKVRRAIPLFPPTRSFKGSPFDPDSQKRLFGHELMNIVEQLAKNTSRSWKKLGYLDFYSVSKNHFESFTTVQINGRNYSAFADLDKKLKKWYGPKYKHPDKKLHAS